MVGFCYSLGPEVLEEEGSQEDLEYKLKGLIDLTLDKRWEMLEALFIICAICAVVWLYIVVF